MIAFLATPFPPVAACPADLAMPGAIVLHDLVPAERIPVFFIAFRTLVRSDKFSQWNGFASAGKLVTGIQSRFGQTLILVNVLNRA